MIPNDLSFFGNVMPASKLLNEPVLKPSDLKILQDLGARLDEGELMAACLFLYSRAERRYHPERCLDTPYDDLLGQMQARKRVFVHRVNEAVDELYAHTRAQPTWKDWWDRLHMLRAPTQQDSEVNVGLLRGWCAPEEAEKFEQLLQEHGIRGHLVKRSEFEKMWNEYFTDLPELIAKK